jgi:para-nitrobenzyl esterase
MISKLCLAAAVIAGILSGVGASARAGSRPATLVVDGGLVAVPAPRPDGVTSFKGLPYAAPPVGPSRWRPPAPLIAWSGVRSAESFGPDCMQAPSENSSPPSRPRSEDCLYLNVWTAAAKGKKQPVYVWIHGGGSRVGSGAQPQFDGGALAKTGIVVVTINYRLGPFGFLSTSALSAESGYGASGNYGFMDDIAALRWVQRNIAAFGGDPTRVTLGGESSGSVSTSTLMVSPLAAGLFHRAIGESGSAFRVAEPGSMGATSLAAEEHKGDALARVLGATDLAQLRAAPAEVILTEGGRMGIYFNLPVVDGHVLPDAPWRLFQAHRYNDVPLLVGWNAQEGSLSMAGLAGTLPQLLGKYYRTEAAKIAPFYPAASPDDIHAKIMAAGDNNIAFGTWKWGIAQQRFGGNPVYIYEFDRAPPVPPGTFGAFDVTLAGAYHGSEMVYAFDTLGAQPTWAVTDADRRVARQMSGYWANFIKTGNPNGAGLPAWPRYDPAQGPGRMRIGLKTGAETDPDYARYLAIEAAHDRVDPLLPVAPRR